MQNPDQTQASNKERFFFVELKSKADLKSLTITNDAHENVVTEGNLGELLQIGFTEDVVLEVVGKKGVLTMELSKTELKNALQDNASSNISVTGFTGGE